MPYMRTHVLDRTNPLDEEVFVGRCRFCGKEDMTLEESTELCPKLLEMERERERLNA